MTVSPFTPLFFLGDHKTDGLESDYVQTFATTDRILIELIGALPAGSWPTSYVLEEPTGRVLFEIVFNVWQINEDTPLRFAAISLNPGYYSVQIPGIGRSEPFRVTDDERELANTTLIQYSMKDNRQRRDAVFVIDNMRYFFDFRVPGGFKDSGWTFGVESEQFTTQLSDIVQLYGLESTQKTFTLGGSAGVPIWFGEMLNRILVCSHVYFDGVKYTRKDTSVPEVAQQLEGHNSFVFTQTLQRSVNIDPKIEDINKILLRRIDGDNYRRISDGLYRNI